MEGGDGRRRSHSPDGEHLPVAAGTILNAAVDDDDYITRSPLVRKSGAGRTASTRNQPVPRRELWLLREQLDQPVELFALRHRALV